MSTRATYLFEPSGDRSTSGRQWLPRTCLYIHYDGYPEGAAFYFYSALCHSNTRGCGPEQMIRAVEHAEVTKSHDAYGDTEFRYTINGWGPTADLMCMARKWDTGPMDSARWELEYAGKLWQFIDKYARGANSLIADYSQFREVQMSADLGTYTQRRWFNLVTARDYLERQPLHHLRIWRANPTLKGWSANWQHCVDEMARLIAAFPELDSDECRELAALYPEPVRI